MRPAPSGRSSQGDGSRDNDSLLTTQHETDGSVLRTNSGLRTIQRIHCKENLLMWDWMKSKCSSL